MTKKPEVGALVGWRPRTSAELATLPEAERKRDEAMALIQKDEEIMAAYQLSDRALRDVDQREVTVYHEVGMAVVDLRQKKGHKAPGILADALGIKGDRLYRMEAFARAFTLDDVTDIMERSPSFGWRKFRILSAIDNKEKRHRLLNLCISENLSVRGLEEKISALREHEESRDRPTPAPAPSLPPPRSFSGSVEYAQARIKEISKSVTEMDEKLFDRLEKVANSKSSKLPDDFSDEAIENVTQLRRALENAIESLTARQELVRLAEARLKEIATSAETAEAPAAEPVGVDEKPSTKPNKSGKKRPSKV